MATKPLKLSAVLIALLMAGISNSWAADPNKVCNREVNRIAYKLYSEPVLALKTGCKKGDAAGYAQATKRLNKAVNRFNKKVPAVAASCDPDGLTLASLAPAPPITEADVRSLTADILAGGTPIPADVLCNNADDFP